jgi:hypothetical protein
MPSFWRDYVLGQGHNGANQIAKEILEGVMASKTHPYTPVFESVL